MEKEVVRSFLYPVFVHPDQTHMFNDQFAFRPTGSTSAALIYLFHHLTGLLQTYEYVHLIALDFSKAFDTVRHSSLISKLADLSLPDNVFHWLADYLSERKHLTKFNGITSTIQSINASIIQGSGLGPTAYVCNASDLHPSVPNNLLFKYADDTYLIVPSFNSQFIHTELCHIDLWASLNNLKLNKNKSLEMIVHSAHRKLTSSLPCTPEVSRVESMGILGVQVNHVLSFDSHVRALEAKAARSMYALKTIKEHGLVGNSLWDVTRATLVSQLQYASPSWSGFLSAADCSRLQAILNKAVRYGFLPKHSPSINDLFQSADQSLFESIIHNSRHVLHQLLPPTKNSGYSLRSQSHQYTLPTISTSNAKKSFINRMLYTNIY